MGKFQLSVWQILAITLVIAAIAAAAGGSAFLLSRSDGVAQVAAPTTVAVSRGDVTLSLAAPGRVAATRTVGGYEGELDGLAFAHHHPLDVFSNEFYEGLYFPDAGARVGGHQMSPAACAPPSRPNTEPCINPAARKLPW